MHKISNLTKYMSTTAVYIAPLGALFVLGLVLNMTNPLESGPLIILAVFVLLYVVIMSVLSTLLHLIATIVRTVRPENRFSVRRGYYVVSIIALAPVLFVALNTLGQLDILEIVLILLLVALGCFYIVRRTVK